MKLNSWTRMGLGLGLMAAVFAVFAAQQEQSQSQLESTGSPLDYSIFIAGKQGYQVNKPVLVGTGSPSVICWSTDGQYAATCLTEKRGAGLGEEDEEEIEVIDLKANKAIPIYRTSLDQTVITDLAFFPGTHALYFSRVFLTKKQIPGSTQFAPVPTATAFTEADLSGKLTNVSTYPLAVNISLTPLYVSRQLLVQIAPNMDEDAVPVSDPPTVAGGPSQGTTPVPASILLLNQAGSIVLKQTLGANDTASVVKGTDQLAITSYFHVQGVKKVNKVIHVLSPSGSWEVATNVAFDPQAGVLPPPPNVYLKAVPVIAHLRKITKKLTSYWIGGGEETYIPDALLTMDGNTCSLSPFGNAVLYGQSGYLFERSLVKVDADSVFQALRAVAVSNAKQAALGLIMYANDFDDNLPPLSGFNNVMPYLKSQEIIDSFQYTYNGNLNMDKIQNPAGTEIGFASGPGGRAVAYADGHVVWVPN